MTCMFAKSLAAKRIITIVSDKLWCVVFPFRATQLLMLYATPSLHTSNAHGERRGFDSIEHSHVMMQACYFFFEHGCDVVPKVVKVCMQTFSKFKSLYANFFLILKVCKQTFQVSKVCMQTCAEWV